MTMLRAFVIALAALLLAACATAPGIPETTYFRLPPRPAVEASAEPVFPHPIAVDTFIADGLHSDQALIYSLDPAGARLRAYHYQLWVDPPVRMLQRRLIGLLREANAAGLVADRLPAQTQRVRVSARLERFERIRRGEGWVTAVTLQIRVDGPDGELPLLLRDYSEEVPADGPSVRDSVAALGRAVDRVYLAFLGDLRAAARG
jgi:uncharacterized lipoprotein YmbA